VKCDSYTGRNSRLAVFDYNSNIIPRVNGVIVNDVTDLGIVFSTNIEILSAVYCVVVIF